MGKMTHYTKLLILNLNVGMNLFFFNVFYINTV